MLLRSFLAPSHDSWPLVHQQVVQHPGARGGHRLAAAADEDPADARLRQRPPAAALGELVDRGRVGGEHDLLVRDLARVEYAPDLVARDTCLHAVDRDLAHRQSATRSMSMPLAFAAWTSCVLPR